MSPIKPVSKPDPAHSRTRELAARETAAKQARGSACESCGAKVTPTRDLRFTPKPGETLSCSPSQLWKLSREARREELAKYELLCAQCRQKRAAKEEAKRLAESAAKHYVFTFEKEASGPRLISMAGASPEDALWTVLQAYPDLDVRDYVRYTWAISPNE